ncbi:MAG: MFS transporter [Zestosphaera sp.]
MVLSVTTLASFLTGLNSRLAMVGFPIVARELNASVGEMLWIVQGYMIGSTIIQLIVGGLADLYGRIKLFNIGFLVFSVAALTAGLAGSPVLLIASRIIQGVGGAFLMTLSITILTDNVPGNVLGTWLGVNQVAWRVGALLGLSISGFVIDSLGWRWLYLAYVPVGLAALLWSAKVLRETYSRTRPPCLDVGGFTSFTAFTFFLLMYLTLLLSGISWGLSVLLVIATLSSLAAFVAWEMRARCTSLDFTVFRKWQFTGGLIAQLLYALGFGSTLTLLVLLLEVAKGVSASVTGLAIMPFEATFLIFGVIGGRLSDKVGYAPVTLAGLVVSSISLYMLSEVTADAGLTTTILATVLLGIGTGAFTAPNTSSIMSAVEPDKRGVASALRMLTFNIGFLASLNMAVLTLIQYIPYDVATRIIISGELVDVEGYANSMATALGKSFLVQAIVMASAIPFTLTRFRRKQTSPQR